MNKMLQHPISNAVAHAVSTSALFAAVLHAVLGILPFVPTFVMAAIGAIWYAIQVYESKTAQRYLRNRRRRKIARLKHQIEILHHGEE